MIHAAPGLSSRDYRRAVELGPSEVGDRQDPVPLHETARFSEVERIDVTETFLSTCSSFLEVRERYEDELRLAEGNDEFEEQQEKKRGLVEGITTGVLRRSLLSGTKPRAIVCAPRAPFPPRALE
jgi:hypothetical protein